VVALCSGVIPGGIGSPKTEHVAKLHRFYRLDALPVAQRGVKTAIQIIIIIIIFLLMCDAVHMSVQNTPMSGGERQR